MTLLGPVETDPASGDTFQTVAIYEDNEFIDAYVTILSRGNRS